MTIENIKDTIQTWIRTADDEFDREEQGRVAGLKMALSEIKKIQEPKWIPCSERLPEENGDYLVTFKLSFMNFIEVCTFNEAGWNKGGYDEVIAWMSLPEVY